MHLTHIPKVLYFQHIIVAAPIQRSAATMYIHVHVSDYQYITFTDMLGIIADSDSILVTLALI